MATTSDLGMLSTNPMKVNETKVIFWGTELLLSRAPDQRNVSVSLFHLFAVEPVISLSTGHFQIWGVYVVHF